MSGERPVAPPRRNLVFTSAGDFAALEHWLAPERSFDLWVSYYGDAPDRYRALADRWWARKGSKFQNLHHVHRSEPGCLAGYDAVMVLDDDIRIDGEGIARLFELRAQHGLSVLQPAFAPPSRISHPITRRRRDTVLRFTRFVEMNCPLFRRASLESFLAEYDPVVIGYGIDHWYMDVLSREPGFRAAIVDSVPCVNPHEVHKGGVREIDRLQPEAVRRAHWERIQRERGIPDADTQCELGRVARPLRERLRGHLREVAAAAWARGSFVVSALESFPPLDLA